MFGKSIKTATLISLVVLGGCFYVPRTRSIRVPPVVQKDWSKFQYPPAGTPCVLSVYHEIKGQVVNSIVPGEWKDGKPWRVRFKIPFEMRKVWIAQIIHEGEVIAMAVFKAPVIFKKDEQWGYRKHLEGIR